MNTLSLRWRLRWLVIGALLVVLVPLGVFSFRTTLRELGELSDGRLAQSAHTLDLMIRTTGLDALHADAAGTSAGRVLMTIPLGQRTFESEVAFQVIDQQGRIRLATANFVNLPAPPTGASGFRDIRLGGYSWRTYTLEDDQSGVVIRAGERYDSRHDISHALLLEHAFPLLLGLPLITLLVGWAVQRGLRPLERLTQTLSSRAPGSRDPILLNGAPVELRPVIDALNFQFGRMGDALERERRFSADVAHELRTPLTTSMISLEAAMGNDDPADAATAIRDSYEALDQLARRVEQLLVLARLESGEVDGERVPIDLVPLAMQVIEELAPTIADTGVHMTLQLPQAQVRVNGLTAGLAALIRNLVENALRHVSDDGHVLLALSEIGSHVVLEVTDNGPGIPPERRAAVFERFHREAGGRGDGYGLGLSIVQRVAQLHGAKIELLDAGWDSGLCVRVTLQAANSD